MPPLHHEHQYTAPAPGAPPDRSRAALTSSVRKIALMNSLAALRTDTITPIKINPYLHDDQDGQRPSPSSQSASTNSTPFFTPRSSLSPVVPLNSNGIPTLDQFMVPSDAGPTSAGLISKSLNFSFRALFENISNGVDGPPISETTQGYQSGHIVISSSMLAAEIIRHLINSGCSDVTDKLDLDQCGTHPIAGGGFGDIYQGALVGGAKNIAREIYAWSKLRHPNILELVGLSTFRGQISIVSSWMENGTLPEYVSKNPEANRFQLCTQVSAGLAYLHRSDVVSTQWRRSIKLEVNEPLRVLYYAKSNVLISGSGVAKLADFGNTVLKKYTLDFTENTGGPRISVRWTAPELLRDGGKYTKEADIYALGMETVSGKTPFGGKSEQVVLGSVLLGKTPERPGELRLMEKAKAETIWKVMSLCWAHTVANRPSASQVKRKLEGVERGQAQQVHVHESIASTAASISTSWWLTGIYEFLTQPKGLYFGEEMDLEPLTSTTPNKPQSDRALKFKSPNFLSPARAAAPTTTETDIVLEVSDFQWGKSDRDSTSTLGTVPKTELPDDATKSMNHESEAALATRHARTRSDSTGSKSSSQGGLLVSPPSSPAVKPTQTQEVDANAPIDTSFTASSQFSNSSRRSSLHDLSLATGTTSLPPSVVGITKTHSRLPSASSLLASAPVLIEPAVPDSAHEPLEPVGAMLTVDNMESLSPPVISFTPANPPLLPEPLVSNSEHSVSELGLSAAVGGMESRSRFPSFSFTPSRASSPPPVPVTSTRAGTTRSNSEPVAPYLKPAVSTSLTSLAPQSTLSPSCDAPETLDPRSPLTNPPRIIFNNPFAHRANEGENQTGPHKEDNTGSNSGIFVASDLEANQPNDSLEGRLGLIREPEKQPDMTTEAFDAAKEQGDSRSLAASGPTALDVIALDSWNSSQLSLPVREPEQSDEDLRDRSGSHNSSQAPSKSTNDSGKQSDWSIEVVPVTPKSEKDQTEDTSPPAAADATIVYIVAPTDTAPDSTPPREPLPPFPNPFNNESASTCGGYESKPSTSSSSGLASEDVSRSLDGGSSADVTAELDLSQRGPHPIAGVGLGDVFRVGTAKRDQPSKIRRTGEQ
ncbi:hypothetical protein FRC10_002451, partial [Ceratobasidium sp. 414]